MEDVTDFVFRELVATKLPRPDVFFTEFTSADGLASKGYEKTVHRLKFSEIQRPIVAQIWGVEPQNIYKASKIVRGLGFDGVDINMGCPDRNVMKKGAGGAMCKNPTLAKEIISACKEGGGSMQVSVKTRLGFNRIITEEWIGFLLEQKIDALTVHGRVAKQKSDGAANWDEIGKCVLLRNSINPATIIIGNGDITGYSDVCSAYEKYNTDGVMIGRGIFKNPWVFEKSQNPKLRSKNDYLALLAVHARLFEDAWKYEKNFQIMKKFFKMYVNNFKGAAALREKLMQTKTVSELNKIIQNNIEY